jgi:hypothetical protein
MFKGGVIKLSDLMITIDDTVANTNYRLPDIYDMKYYELAILRDIRMKQLDKQKKQQNDETTNTKVPKMPNISPPKMPSIPKIPKF